MHEAREKKKQSVGAPSPPPPPKKASSALGLLAHEDSPFLFKIFDAIIYTFFILFGAKLPVSFAARHGRSPGSFSKRGGGRRREDK